VFFTVLFPSIESSGYSENLANTEDSLSVWFNHLHPRYSLEEKHKVNQKIIQTLEPVLKQQHSFFHSFDSVKQMGCIMSPDSTFKIFTWNLPLEGGVHEYYGFIQQYTGDGSCKVFQLHDHINTPEHLSMAQYCHDTWHGMLYYEIIPVINEGKQYYTLLGLDYYNLVTSRKIVDILYFNQKGSPCFGAPLISINDTLQNRFILEYSSKIVTTLRYKKNRPQKKNPVHVSNDDIKTQIQQEIRRNQTRDTLRQKIIFDHLVPANPKFKGNYGYYGPGGTYDALIFKKGVWKYYEDINPME
jgi:hypothetical protein